MRILGARFDLKRCVRTFIIGEDEKQAGGHELGGDIVRASKSFCMEQLLW